MPRASRKGIRRRVAVADRGITRLFQDRGRQNRPRKPSLHPVRPDLRYHRVAGSRAQARQLEIAAYIDERLPIEVIGDAARLRQVLLNLAGNAIKFTPSGGSALIVEPGIEPGEIRFMVRDTGIGIAPDAQARIFYEFEQADERIARNYGGTGLGLSISDRIVKRMGGRITLESTGGRVRHSRCRYPFPPKTAPQRESRSPRRI